MAIKQQRRVFDDWRGGHYGSMGPFKCADNQYRAVNVQMYRNGTMGPRPGWKRINTTGTAPAPVAGTGTEFYGMTWVVGTTNSGWLVFISRSTSAACRALNMDTRAWSSPLTIGVPPNDMQIAVNNGGSVWSHQADWALVGATDYENLLTGSSGTISYPDSFSPRASVAYRTRMYAWGDATYPNRIYYSNPDNFGAMVSGQYFNVGLAGTVMGCWSLGDSLLILTLAGAINGLQQEAEWWTLTGASPVVGTLRRVDKGVWPGAPPHATVYQDTLVFQDSFYDRGIMIHDGQSLNRDALQNLTLTYGNKLRGGASLDGTNLIGEPGVVFAYVIGASHDDPTGDLFGEYYDNGVQAWELVNGVWTKAVYWEGALDAPSGAEFFLKGLAGWQGNKLLAAVNTNTGSDGEYTFYYRDLTLDRFASTSDTFSGPGDEDDNTTPGNDGSEPLPNILWLSAIQAELGQGLRVRRVIVDVDYWNNGFGAGASLQCSTGNYRLEDGLFVESTIQTSDTAELQATTELLPLQARLVFNFDSTPWYSASQVRFHNISRMAIDKVTVDYEINDRDPR